MATCVCPWAAKNVHAFYHWCADQAIGCEPHFMWKGAANYFCGMWTLWHILSCSHPLELVCNMATEAIKLAVCWKQQIHIGAPSHFLMRKCTSVRLFHCLFFSVAITLACILLPISLFFFHVHCATTIVALLRCPSASRQQIPCWQLYSFVWMQHSFKALITTCLTLQKMSCSEAQRCSSA